jgi:FixJ family two-component response regulator
MTLTGRTVLLLEDDDSMREAIERLLVAAGFEPAAYVSAEELLASHDLEGVTCVVTDLKLPAMSGLELLAHLRSRGVEAPVILITAHDKPGLREDVLRRGAAAYLAKPFRGTALLATIRSVIDPTKTRQGRE